jgi:hypothetical protein
MDQKQLVAKSLLLLLMLLLLLLVVLLRLDRLGGLLGRFSDNILGLTGNILDLI